MENISIKNITFKNELLEKAANVAMFNDCKVFIFQERNISQIFVENLKGNVGTISADFGSVQTGSVHMPCRSCGTGFQIEKDMYHIDIAHINSACNCIAPHWFSSDAKDVIKWKSFEQKAKSCSLKYREVIK